MSKNQFRNAFTLLELIAVLVILVALTALLATSVFERIKRANISATKVQIGNFTQSLERYQLDHGSFPTTEQGLNALIYIPSNELQAGGTTVNPMNGGMGTQMPGTMGATALSTDSLGNAMPGAIDPTTGMPMGSTMPGAMPATGLDTTMPMNGGGIDPMTGMPPSGNTMPGAIDPMTGMPVAGGATGTGMAGMSNWTQSTFNPQLYVNARMRPEPYFESNEAKIPNDQWGMPYHYEYVLVNGINPRTGKNSPAIWSSGPDKTDGTDDDIRNFDPVQVATQLQLTPNPTNPMQPNPMGMDGGMIDPATGMPMPTGSPMSPATGFPTQPPAAGFPTAPPATGFPTQPPATGFPTTPDNSFPAQPPMPAPGM